MTDNTLLDLEARSIAGTLPAVQTGPVYHCFHCGARVEVIRAKQDLK